MRVRRRGGVASPKLPFKRLSISLSSPPRPPAGLNRNAGYLEFESKSLNFPRCRRASWTPKQLQNNTLHVFPRANIDVKGAAWCLVFTTFVYQNVQPPMFDSEK